MQLNCSGSDPVPRVFGVDGGGFPGLKMSFVSHKEPRTEKGARTSINFSSCFAIPVTNFARDMGLGSSR